MKADAVVLRNIAKKRGNRYFNLPEGELLHIIIKYVEFINMKINKIAHPRTLHLIQNEL
jgi:hypothetical protein